MRLTALRKLDELHISKAKEGASMSLVHLTVADKPHQGLDILLESARRCNVQTRVLGLGSQEPVGHGKGFGFKLRLVKKELSLLPPLQIVMFTDAYDVLFHNSPSMQGLIDYFNSNPSTVLFAAEKAKWPDKDEFYPVPLQNPFPYLNSGVYAGRAIDLLELLQEPFDTTTDDQRYFVKQYISQKGRVKLLLDHTAKYFACFYGVQHSQVVPRGSNGLELRMSSYNAVQPFVLHLNNGGVRFKWYQRVTSMILGDQYSAAAREVAYKSILGPLTPLYDHRQLVFIMVIFILIFLAYKNGFSI